MKVRIPEHTTLRIFPLLFTGLVYLLLVVAAQFITRPLFSPLWSVAMLIGMTAASMSLSVLRDRRNPRPGIDGVEDLLKAAKARAEQDLPAFTAELRSDVIFRCVWLAAAWLAAATAILFSAQRGIFVTLLCHFIGLYYLTGLNHFVITARPAIPPEIDMLPRKDYPQLYATAQKALGKRYQIRIYSDPVEALSVSLHRGHAFISIGPLRFAALSDAELEALLCYCLRTEEAHTLAPALAERFVSTPPSSACLRFLVMVDLLMQYPMTGLARSLQVYQYGSGCAISSLAVTGTKAAGYGESFLSGMMKLRMLAIHEVMEPAAHTRIYTGPEPDADIVEREYAVFLKLFKQRKALWRDLLLKELPSDTGRLSYPEMLQLTGLPTPDPVPEAAAEGERAAVLKWGNARFLTELSNNYEANRTRHELEPRAIVNRYLDDTAAGKSYTAVEMRPVLDACHTLTESDLLIELCDKTIALSRNRDEAAHARFLLGRELLHRYDLSGFDLVLEAVENNENYIREGGRLVDELSAFFGLAEDRPRYLARLRAAARLASERNTLNPDFISADDRLSAEFILPRVQAEENLSFILSACNGHLKKLYALDRELSDSYSGIVYIVEFAADTPPDEKQAALDKLYNYLDSLKHYYFVYELDQLDFDPNDYEGSCIWVKR